MIDRPFTGRLRSSAIVTVMCATLLVGCASVTISGRSKSSSIPLLFNDKVGRDYTVVSHVSKSFSYWWLFWGAFRLSEMDLVDLVNNDVKRVGGDAVINLKLTGRSEAVDGAISFLTAGLMFGRTYELNGDIIKYKNP